jgi:signal transduction histidine kinase
VKYIILLPLLVLLLLFVLFEALIKSQFLFSIVFFCTSLTVNYYLFFRPKYLAKRIHSIIFCVCISYTFAFYCFFKLITTGNIFWVFFSSLGNSLLSQIALNYVSAVVYLLGYFINYWFFFKYYDKQFLIYLLINIHFTCLIFFLLFIMRNKLAKLVKSGKKSEDFINFVTHEIRVCLQGMDLMFDYLTQNWINLSFERRQSYLEIIKASSSQLMQLSTNILNLQYFQSTSENLNLKYACISDLILEVIQGLKPFSLISGSKIFFNHNSYSFYFDAAKIKHILRNIISNAIKYGNGLEIKISIMHKEDKNIIIKVSDYGFGISQSDKENLFKPFWKGDKESFNKISSGYGLFLSYTFIKQHDGYIWVEDNFPQGSIFCISLPIITTGTTSIKIDTQNNLITLGNFSHAQKHYFQNIYSFKKPFEILIVDDDLTCLLSLKLILQACSHNITTAQSFAQASFLIKNQLFDIIFLDVMMHSSTIQSFIDDFVNENNFLPLLILQSGLLYDVFESENAKSINLNIIFAYLQKPYGRREIEELFNYLHTLSKPFN